ncbi:hypothetical protein ACFFRR_006737 [Megaselia abdita]
MLNGKFYTGLPPKMIDRQSNGPNRQQSHFFWPDDSQLEPAVPPRSRRPSSNINSDVIPNNKREPQHPIEPTKLFMNEFNKSKIHFYDVPDKGALPQANSISGGNKSQIQFFDYAGEEKGRNINNRHPTSVVVSVEERNLKSEVEKNLKNSPKLQDKKFVEKSIKKILKPTNKLRGDFMENQKSNRRIHYKDEVDERYDYDNEESTQFYPKSPLPRHRFRSRLDESAEEKTTPVEIQIPHQPTSKNNQTHQSTQRTTSSSHKHLVSNINFQSDSNSGFNNETIIIPARRNVRSSAVMRVSVGLPEEC